ncbi:MAG: endopeptidase La [Chloroflexota bacterium]
MSDELERLITDLLSDKGGNSSATINRPDSPDQDSTLREGKDTFDMQEIPILPLRGMVVYPQTAIPLTVGQPRSITLVDDVIDGERLVGLVTAHDEEQETPGPDEVYRVGTLASIHRLFRAPDGTIRLLVQGIERIRVTEFTGEEPYLTATIVPEPEAETFDADELTIEASMRSITERFRALADLMPSIPDELVASATSADNPLQLIYSIATYVRIDIDDAQRLLEMETLEEKMRFILELLNKEIEVLELGRKIQTEAQSEMEKTQREYYLREQMKAIQRELSNGEEDSTDAEQFRQRIDESDMPEEARKEAERELSRLTKLSVASAEYGVIRTYLDWLTNMPWNERTDDNLDIAHAREVLNKDHYGLKDIKERILEFLAVRKLRRERANELEAYNDTVRKERNGAILCFVGPPGVGKTSLGASIARAMGRKFVRLSLGGIRDEAEIRGFRRTYIGAMPGRIVQTLRRLETRNPLILLDEVDKLGRDFRGDPASALLELLDPEQNSEFRDTYLDVPFDLSEVFFICTANTLDTIPGPLRDRMEIIQLSGYTEQEKLSIAREYLVPRQVRENGLRDEEIDFNDDALMTIIRDFTREAGVRNLEREIGRVARKVVTKIAEGTSETVDVDGDSASDLLGKPRFGRRTELEDRLTVPGVATGLAWTPVGGEVLFIEATAMPGKNGFKYTGQLGDVMQESAQLALSYLRSRSEELGIDGEFFGNHDIHLHVPAGATPKDGPSAGITMTTALASLLTNRPTKRNIAMTGEVNLGGQVLPVGGIKDKVLAAHRLGVDTVILPKKNEVDLDELPDEIRESMTFHAVEHIDAVLDLTLEGAGQSTAS